MRTYPLALGLLLASCAAVPTPQDEHAGHSGISSSPMTASRLDLSPRHQEWVEVKNGEKTIHTWVVYPEVGTPRPVILLIHENRGLNDWARGMADQVAEAGYIAVAPDLLSGFSASERRTSDFANEDAARTALTTLKPEAVGSDLDAVIAWSKTIPASNGSIVAAGFCWGGTQAFRLATESSDLAATLVFYGSGPESADAYARITSPVYGFYGGADERINATIPASEAAMKAAGKTYEPVVYDGAGHAFMRSGEDPKGDPKNIAARDAAWKRMMTILQGIDA